MNFYDVTSDGVVDNAGYDRLSAFGFESTLVTVELIAMTAYIMLTTRFKYQFITTWTCLVINNYVAIFSLPDKIDVATDYMTILIQMTEGLLMVTFDSFSVFLFERINEVVPCIPDSLRLMNILFGETIAVA